MNQERREAIRQGVIRKLMEKGEFKGNYVRLTKSCEKCGDDFKPHRTSQRFCSTTCRVIHDTPEAKAKAAVEKVTKRRRKLKAMAVGELGGCCMKCGYDKCIDALEFHHNDPKQKEFQIGSGNTMAWDRIKEELKKCILVCANCHREIHAEVGD